MSAEAASPRAAAMGENGAGEKESQRKKRWETLVEIVEVLVLAIVAVATSYSGYVAARWDGRQALLYGHASTDRSRADAASTRGGQELVADASIFTAIALALAAYTVIEMLTLPRI
ncbi:MAG TPA: hypothetical protein VFJ07_13425 [Streptosporangiaceae bacterium]|nr:hypothetical protein [Streptosporangiaceae bacterium]